MKYVALCLLILTSCRSHAVFREIDPSFNRMQVQPRVDPYEESAFFSDGLDMRQPPRGTVPFSPRPTSTRPPLTRALLERGAAVVRSHDVAATVDALAMWTALNEVETG